MFYDKDRLMIQKSVYATFTLIKSFKTRNFNLKNMDFNNYNKC